MPIEMTPVLTAYVASATVLGLNLLVLANNTALTRARAKEVINPEDVVLNAGANVVFEAGNDKTERYRRAHRNALENIPLFLMTGFVLALTGVSTGLAIGLFAAFVVARLVHSVAYVRRVQPVRTLSFVFGALVQLAILAALAHQALLG